jgi:hypothetical protein
MQANKTADAQGYAERYEAYQYGKYNRGPAGYDYGLGGDDAQLIRFEVDRIIQEDRGHTLAHPPVYAQHNATNQHKREANYARHGLDAGISVREGGLRKLAADWRNRRVKAPEFSLGDPK